MKKNKLSKIVPEKTSISGNFKIGKIPVLKSNHYEVQTGYTITGEAPKQFIRVYEYGLSKKENKKTWPLYIAKTARKWYPNESFLEYLLNRIGVIWGLNMAYSRLVWGNGQIRFLSKYFLQKKHEELIHCADIYRAYFNDKDFIDDIEKNDLERAFNSVQLFHSAVKVLFQDDSETIFEEYIKMLLFDALVGINDRHFYNYGIIKHISNEIPKRFAPIYDTARGLLWNESEEKIVTLSKKPLEAKQFLEKYINKSLPKIGWDGQPTVNHFKLIELITENEFGLTKENIRSFYSVDKLEASLKVIDIEFSGILSFERINLIKQCLVLRFEKLKQITI